MQSSHIIIGVDTGGTFTDFVFKDNNGWGVHKVLSTPHNPSKAVIKGLRMLAAGTPKQVVHGSTVATNAILERKGVKTALIANKGFEDVIEIGRQNRSRLYDLAYKKTPCIVPYSLRFGITGRILYSGMVLEELDPAELQRVVNSVHETGAESVAVCLLFSYTNPCHEKHLGELLSKLNMSVSLSHEILAEFREFERTSTTVINAYVSPIMKKYLDGMQTEFSPQDILRIMQSNGGSISASTAMNESARTILSGPAGGVIGAYEIGKIAGFTNLITLDMGGTSTDVSLILQKPSLTLESTISEYPLKLPMIDIHTVGAGGGSIARIDTGGSLQVGPKSAGADPGPICYGKGNQITVTDAHLYLGRLIAEHFLGGAMSLQYTRLDSFFELMSKKLGLTSVELAEGILDVANTCMERAIRVISVERGHDPRDFSLFAFGGAGGMHAAFLAHLLNIPRVIIPQNPGILSAIGMLLADIIKDYSRTVMLDALQTESSDLDKYVKELENKAISELASEGINHDKITFEHGLDMRYKGQSFEILVPYRYDFIESFHALHEQTYGHRNNSMPVEIVGTRLRAIGTVEKPAVKRQKAGGRHAPDEAVLGEKDTFFEGKNRRTKIIKRDHLLSGNQLTGPAVIVEYSGTIVMPPFASAVVDEFGNIVMEIT